MHDVRRTGVVLPGMTVALLAPASAAGSSGGPTPTTSGAITRASSLADLDPAPSVARFS